MGTRPTAAHKRPTPSAVDRRLGRTAYMPIARPALPRSREKKKETKTFTVLPPRFRFFVPSRGFSRVSYPTVPYEVHSFVAFVEQILVNFARAPLLRGEGEREKERVGRARQASS